MVGVGWWQLVMVLVCFLIAKNVEFIAEFPDFSGKCDNGIKTKRFLKKKEMW